MRIITILLMSSLFLASAEAASLAELFPSDDAFITPPLPDSEFMYSDSNGELADGGQGDEVAMLAFDMAKTESAARDSTLASEAMHELLLEIRDIESGDLIRDAHIRVYMDDGTQHAGTLRYVGEDGRMSLQLPAASWKITLKLDITSTPGKDYYSQFQVILAGDINMSAFMQPVGSLGGEVIDSEDRLVPGAELKFDCRGDYGELASIRSDQFGSFSAEWLPVGQCKVSALNGGMAGSHIVEISHGQMSSVTIMLETAVASPMEDYSWLLLPITLAILGLSVIITLVIFKKPRGRLEQEAPPEIKPDRHMQDVLQALDENERRILESLMEKGGESLQNRMTREFGWPKSSMSRALGGLEARNLITTEKLGRIKRIRLSEWFLNGKKA
jgi:hypothetical protein